MIKLFWVLGSLNAFLSVVLGAFGAHALKAKIPANLLSVYETGVQYHMVHAIGLILIALAADRFGASTLLNWSGWMLFLGIIFFSGSLYALSLSGVRILGAITPIGGVLFLAGWILFALAAFKQA